MPQKGFTLAELLIALAILGVIATFTIPKVLQSQTSSQYKSMAKEAAGFVSQAYIMHQQQGSVGATTVVGDFTPYMNYVNVQTTGAVERYQKGSNWDCSVFTCLRLHNGATLVYNPVEYFNSTGSTAAVWFGIDPDGKVTNGGTGDTSVSAPGKSVLFFLYLNGKLRTRGTVEPNTTTRFGTYSADPTQDPPWFSWN